jgi:hypothetical protein
MFYGTIPKIIGCCGPDHDGTASAISWQYFPNKDVLSDYSFAWCECPKCHKLGIQYEACGGNCGCFVDDKTYNGDSPRLLKAYQAAKSARFEV